MEVIEFTSCNVFLQLAREMVKAHRAARFFAMRDAEKAKKVSK